MTGSSWSEPSDNCGSPKPTAAAQPPLRRLCRSRCGAGAPAGCATGWARRPARRPAQSPRSRPGSACPGRRRTARSLCMPMCCSDRRRRCGRSASTELGGASPDYGDARRRTPGCALIRAALGLSGPRGQSESARADRVAHLGRGRRLASAAARHCAGLPEPRPLHLAVDHPLRTDPNNRPGALDLEEPAHLQNKQA